MIFKLRLSSFNLNKTFKGREDLNRSVDVICPIDVDGMKNELFLVQIGVRQGHFITLE